MKNKRRENAFSLSSMHVQMNKSHTKVGGISMELKNGMNLHVIQTSKFKDIGISFRFMNQLEEKKATVRSLLALMLCDRCVRYDTKKAMSKKLDELYGATFSTQTVGYGAAQVLDIRSKIIHPSYTSHPTLLCDLLDFFKDVLLKPLFNDEILNENKAILKAKMERMQDEPSQYAISKGLKLAGEGQPLGISALGEINLIDAITLEDIKQAYEEMIHHDRIDILLCGDIKEEDVMDVIEERFPFTRRNSAFETTYAFTCENLNQESFEYRHISQSNIMMIWMSNTTMRDANYYALKVANAMFGQYPTSFLFQEVREKNSLCYSVYSNMIAYDGALAVTTGVEKNKIQKAIELINIQFQRLCDGDFDDELITVSKTMIINSLTATKDSMLSLLALKYQNAILDDHMGVDDLVQKMQEVTREDILTAIQQCKLAYTFVLTNKEDVHEEN